MAFTSGSGMAAASSMTSSSACARRSWCCGWMYWTVCKKTKEVLSVTQLAYAMAWPLLEPMPCVATAFWADAVEQQCTVSTR